jgi:hypothetical protein
MDAKFSRVVKGERPSASRDNAIASEVERLSRRHNGGDAFIDNGNGYFPINDHRDLILVENAGSEEIPAYALMETMVGTSNRTATGRQASVRVRKTDANGYGAQYSHLVNGPNPISIAGYGRVLRNQNYVWALYDSSFAPTAVGQVLGPARSSFKLKLNVGGYVVVGDIITADTIVLVCPCPCLEFIGTTASSGSKGSTCTVTAPDGTVVTANCRYVAVSSGQKVRVGWIPTANTASVRWELIDKEC